MGGNNFYFLGQFLSPKAIFMGENNFYRSLQQSIYFMMLNSNFTKILGDKMNYTLLKEFEKYVDGKFDECISPVSVLPFLCSKYDYNYESILNELRDWQMPVPLFVQHCSLIHSHWSKS